MLGQLALDHRVVLLRVGAVERREVEHVDQQPRALDVGEEVVAEAGAGARALDQPGDVGDHELAVGGLERAEVRLQRRERVAGDLRLRAREPRDQRRLAGVRQPHEPDVGEQLEVQLDQALLAVETLLGHPRRLPRRARELPVPAPAGAAARERDLLPGRDEVVAGAVPALDLRARRHADDQRLAVGPVALRALAVPSALRAEVRAAAERLQVAQRVVDAHEHVAAAAAVAAVRPALGHVRLAAERHDAVAATAGANLDLGAVMEHGRVTVAACPRTQIPSSSSPAPPPASAPPPPAPRPRPATASCSPRAPPTRSRPWPRSSRRPRGHLRRHRVGATAEPRQDRARRLRPHRRRLRQRRLRRPARLPEGRPRGVEGDGPDQRLRRRADDPRDDGRR